MGRYFTVRFRTKNVLGLNRYDYLEVLADDVTDAIFKARDLYVGEIDFRTIEVIPDVAL